MDKNISTVLEAFPVKFENDIKSIFNILTLNTDLYNGGDFEVKIDGQIIYIPERVYYEEPNEILETKLTERQRQILDCFFTRHHDGYVRQKRLKNIFNRGTVEKWIIPYIIRLTGEYLIEIIEDIYTNINLINKDELKEFITENQRFIMTTEGRIASYWGEYYMSYIKKNEYVGFKIKKYIKSLNK